MVPTLDLAAQTALVWRRDNHLEHMVIVSSLGAGGRDDWSQRASCRPRTRTRWAA
ncbi:hypothetical protein ACFW40_34330 [Streptomyces sp. NPDC058807]|uniref:hypothetical protein n=1 Tax=unclassified Streptomyces TaxID=2593676 RepID=UPI0036AD6D83